MARISFALVVALVTASPLTVFGQDTQKLIRDIPLPTKDGWTLAATYYQSTIGKEAPVVVLLHSKGGNRLAWKTGQADKTGKWTNGLADRLNKEAGFAVIAVDLRKHGQSRSPQGLVGSEKSSKSKRRSKTRDEFSSNDYKSMVLFDLKAVKKFIKAEHQDEKLNMRKMAIVAADMTVPIAIHFALADWMEQPYPDAPVLAARTPRGQDVRALVLLSPESNLPGIPTTEAVNRLRSFDIAFLLCRGQQDRLDKGATKKLHTQISNVPGAEERIYLREYSTKYRGTDLIGKRQGVEGNIVKFLELHVKNLPDVWRNRKSKLLD